MQRSHHSHRGVARFALALTAVATLTAPLAALAAVGDTVTDAIVGQPDAVTRTANSTGVNASGLAFPIGTATDAAGNLYVADSENHRVLIYFSPFTTDRVADRVLGQGDFNTNTPNSGGPSAGTLSRPSGVAVDKQGNVWVADTDNHRVLEYDAPLTNDTVADRVYGQPDFTSNTANNGGIGESTLYIPADVVVDDQGNLWVADSGNLRVLEYDTPVASGDRAADLVVCQARFDTDRPGTSDTLIESLTGIAVDSKRNLWVSDSLNSRVLEFDDPKRFGGEADRILGQSSFTSSSPNYTGRVDGLGLYNPHGVETDVNDNVYVSDIGNNRVLFYRAPIALADREADHAFGQPDLTSDAYNNGGVSAATLFNPIGVARGPKGEIVIADLANHRMVLLETPVPIVTSITVKVSPKTGIPVLVIQGFGMVSGRATVSVNGVPLTTVKYKKLASDGTATTIRATDPRFDMLVRPGSTVYVTVSNSADSLASAPIPVTR